MIKLVEWEFFVWQGMDLTCVFSGLVSIVMKLDLLISIRVGSHIQTTEYHAACIGSNVDY